MRKNDIFCFHNFGGAIDAQGVTCHRRVRKGVIKLQQIISKHKQAYNPTAIQQIITEKNSKKDIFCNCNIGRVCTVQIVICLLWAWKVVIKIHKIICKHKQAYISITICPYTDENKLKRRHFVFAVLGVFLLPKVLYSAQECKRV